MADWVRTYIDKIDEILKADFNTELAAIDNTLKTVPNANIFKSYQPFTQAWPHIWQALDGDSEMERTISSANLTILWNHFVGVRTVDVSPTSSVGNEIYAYVEAILKAVYKGNGNAGKLDGVACNTRPVLWQINRNVGTTEEGGIIREGGILFEIDIAYDILE